MSSKIECRIRVLVFNLIYTKVFVNVLEARNNGGGDCSGGMDMLACLLVPVFFQQRRLSLATSRSHDI